MLIQSGDTVLFQGDSITDAGRVRDNESVNDMSALGKGYAKMAAAQLLADRPGDGLRFHNRGISGNRVVDLYARWKVDALNLKPDVISILIGVNDTWHHFMYDNGVEVPRYERFYRDLLAWTREALPDVKLVLCEPFFLRCGVVTEAWHVEIEARQKIVRTLADEFDARFVGFQKMFDQAATEAPPDYWARDGVHPTPPGHHRMAQLWLSVVNA